MPRETVEAFQYHGHVEETLTRDVEQAERVFEALSAAGIDYDEVVATIEREGVEKFAKSFADLIEGIEAKRDSMVAA